MSSIIPVNVSRPQCLARQLAAVKWAGSLHASVPETSRVPSLGGVATWLFVGEFDSLSVALLYLTHN